MSSIDETKCIYNSIARDFSRTRYKIWPGVSNFLDQFANYSNILDIGCGNGKNILAKPNLNFKGIDISSQMIQICQSKGLDCVESSMTLMPFQNDIFDGFICIASYHHLSNEQDRIDALNEMYRILKYGGVGLITVWAMEQPSDSKFKFTKSDEYVKWKCVETKQEFYRYYHIYKINELETEIKRLQPKFKIQNVILEKGNWNIQVLKI